jgi:poly(3-hydroxybutyrate) depolymerase
VARVTASYPKPAFGLDHTEIDGEQVAVREVTVHRSPFCRLLHFERAVDRADPPLLVVAPLSGHHATLLRETVRELLPDHDVYLTDWIDAREVPLALGRFDLEDVVDLLRTHLRLLGPKLHVLSICQPAVPVLAAVARLAEDGEVQPRSVTLVSGPVDTRLAPTAVGRLASRRTLAEFEAMAIHPVPAGNPGAGRRVYPGVLQLSGFLSLDIPRHVEAHFGLWRDVVLGNAEGAERHRRFYDEYFAVMDLPAEFYLQTVDQVFQRHALARGAMLHRGRSVRAERITDTALMTVEGAEDDITGVGQTQAAHALCSAVPDTRREHLHVEGAGHYGTFSGRRWREQVAPALRAFIRRSA